MHPDQVFTEITLKISPNRMDVVGILTRIVELYQKGFALYPVIMLLSGLHGTRPAKSYGTKIFFLDLLHSKCSFIYPYTFNAP